MFGFLIPETDDFSSVNRHPSFLLSGGLGCVSYGGCLFQFPFPAPPRLVLLLNPFFFPPGKFFP